jgi:hypothetical protein
MMRSKVIQGRLKAAIRGRTPLYERFLRVYRYEFDVEKHGGGTRRSSWEMMERGNAVAVLGHDPERGRKRVDTGSAGGIHGNASENEDILTVVLSAKPFIDRVRSGDINDLKTLVAGYWFAEQQAADKF